MKLDVDVNLHLLMNSIEDLKRQIENEKEDGRGWMLKYDDLDIQFEVLVTALYEIQSLDGPSAAWEIAKKALNEVNR